MITEAKAFQLSVILHALIIIFIVSMSDSIIHSKDFIVIDFSMEDSINIQEGKSLHVESPFIKMKKSVQEKKTREHNKPESVVQNTMEESVQTTEAPPMKDMTQDSLIEAREEAFFNKEKNVIGASKEFQDILNTSSGNIDKREAKNLGRNPEPKVGIEEGPKPGSFKMLQTKREGYLGKNFLYIKEMIQKKISYPAEARRMGWTGSAKVAFNILSSGYVNDVKIIESTGYKTLDSNVIKAIQEASPFPKPPVEAQIIIPIVYRIQ